MQTSASAATWWLSGGIAAANCIAAYAPKGAASLTASYSNLNNPGTNNAAPGVAPTFATVTGWTFNGTTQYLTTGIIPSSSWTLIVRFSNCSGSTAILIGSEGSLTNDKIDIFARVSSGASRLYRNGNTTGLAVSGALTSGVIAIAGASAYLNGSAETGSLGNNLSGALALFIGARNATGFATGFAAADIYHVGIYNTALNSTQIAALTTAMNAL